MQVGELPQHFPVFGIQSLDECRIVRGLRLTVGSLSCREASTGAADGLPTRRRQLPPARKQGLPDIRPVARGSSVPTRAANGARPAAGRESGGSRLRGAGESAPAVPAADSGNAGCSAGTVPAGAEAYPGTVSIAFRGAANSVYGVATNTRGARRAFGSLGRTRGRPAVRAIRVSHNTCWVIGLNLCPYAEPHRRPATSQAAKTAPNWNRSFITCFLLPLLARTQCLDPEARKAHRISR